MPRISSFVGTKFVTRPTPIGFGIRFLVNDDNSVFARVTFDESKEGGNQIVHGGAMSTVLDEAMGTASYEAHSAGYTATMTFNYASHVPLHQEILIEAWVDKVEGKKMFAKCRAILADGTIAVTGGAFSLPQKSSMSISKLIHTSPKKIKKLQTDFSPFIR